MASAERDASAGEPLRILLAFDTEIVTDGLQALLTQELGERVDVVGRISRGDEMVEAIRGRHPQVVVFDPELPGLEMPVIEAVAADDGTGLLALELGRDRSRSWDLLRRGASGYLDAGASTQELLEAIQVVARGEVFLSSRATRGVIERMARPPGAATAVEQLTSREREILHLVAEGLSSKGIADRLELSVRTVETHRVHLMAKLRAENTAHLVRLAIREGLIGP